MGNTLREQHGEASTLFPSSILAQTSLHPLCYKSYVKSCSGAISTNDTRINTLDTLSEKKDRSNCSESKSGEKNGCRVDEKGDLTKDDFKILKVLGCEGLGKMYLVKKDDEEKLYTMKTIDKRKIASLGCIDSIESERLILEKANHPFIPKLRYTFENDKKIFFVFDQIEGEKLNIVLHHLTKFSEEITRFYAAEIIVALEYLHKEMKTSFQDLEIENIRLDNEGHINLIDFAKTKSLDLDNISSEKMNKRKMIDFYHLGCLIYELLAGKKLYGTEEDMKNALKEKNAEKNLTWPKHVSKTARDLITRLLTQKTEERLGYNNIEEIKTHPFFDGIKWEKIQQKLMYPPISPPKPEEGCDTENEESCFSFNELDDMIDKENRRIKPEIKRRITT